VCQFGIDVGYGESGHRRAAWIVHVVYIHEARKSYDDPDISFGCPPNSSRAQKRRGGDPGAEAFRQPMAAVEIYRHKEGAVLLDLRIDPGAQYTEGALVTAATFRKPETFETTDSTISALNTQMMDALLSDR
jgi:hypothetical protein